MKVKEQMDAISNAKLKWSEEAQKFLKEMESFELNYTPSLHEAWERVSQNCPNQTRYEKDCIRLFYLTKRQLNLEKNASKGDFEDLSIFESDLDGKSIFSLFEEEYHELMSEIIEEEPPGVFYTRKKINYQRAREEIGDVAACLVGLLAKLNKMEKEEK